MHFERSIEGGEYGVKSREYGVESREKGVGSRRVGFLSRRGGRNGVAHYEWIFVGGKVGIIGL